MEFRAKASFR